MSVLASPWVIARGWRTWSIRAVSQECEQLQRNGSWGRLLRSSRAWLVLQPDNREARKAGVVAGKALRDVDSVREFLNDYPCEIPDDVPLISMFADLNFGPLNDPFKGAAACRDILKVTANHQESHRRLVFFYAMTQQQGALQAQIQEALINDCDLPEVFAYSFLGTGLQLSNGRSVTENWLRDAPENELLIVAHALHFAQSVSGAVPSVDEEAAEKVRQMQSECASHLQQLLSRYPTNQELLAYHLQKSIQDGAALNVGELLTVAPPNADGDYRFWHARGWAFSRLADHEEAERCYRKALVLNSLDWRTQYHLAALLRTTGRLDESDELGQLAADGRSLERNLLEQRDMQSIPLKIYKRLAEYSRQCESELFLKHLIQYLNAFEALQESGARN